MKVQFYKQSLLVDGSSDEISKLELFISPEIESALRSVADKHQIKGGRIIHPVRIAVTGSGVGPSLFELLELLGRDTVIRRIHRAAKKLK